ncbi:MAG: cryptochrome/photolyase family protein [Pseudotabrizicola sp.]|uniref:cryptochrome/photolyase family protein n=1 Tax=Pseudotabrizicola sp. TaxID=2939647 RepID=UPI00272EEBB0|nr:cryptochrome/photolyase family protein [Pseudotabrizicola sp.]MDP2081677.1 cryptochrome/photolyase family protein [Pseudotabrizicola sp.]MDZ7574027.1 cryptochrome/photolyase family protein [Pseudotabrizicola sp.]
MKRLVLILGDQLTPALSALRAADPARDVVVMAEVRAEGTYVPHHPQKIALILSAMRHFAAQLREAGWHVAYSRFDDPDNSHTIAGELLRRAAEHGATEVLATRPGEWRLITALDDMPLPVTQQPDDRFLCSDSEFAAWAEGRKQFRMEWFYREMRRKTGFLMQDGQPVGGKWNYDHDNRKAAKPDLFRPRPPRFDPDATTAEVLDLVAAEFPDHFGRLRPFRWGVTRANALEALDWFTQNALQHFGDEQDAMLVDDPTLSHSLLSPYLNIGLLSAHEVCAAAEAAYHAGKAPLNAVEGFIRQIIGWREYVRGIYMLHGPGYADQNALGADRALPALYWGAKTDMACLSHAVAQTRDLAYAHHIQRLMVTGLFGLIAGLSPQALHEWYLSVYIDAFEWVEAPNTIGMSQFADGGILGSKPYAASGAYIHRMSDYCGDCRYKVALKTGPDACPFNPLYWHFLMKHRDRFASNPRMAQMYRTWDKMDDVRQQATLSDAEAFLRRMDTGKMV